MIDLNRNVFYKAAFTLTAREPGMDLLWELIGHLRHWLGRKADFAGTTVEDKDRVWSRLKTGGRILSEDGISFAVETVSCPAEGSGLPAWVCRVVERRASRDGCAPRTWETEVGFDPHGPDSAGFSVVITYSDRPGFLGPCEPEPEPNIPRLVTNVLNDTRWVCTHGCDTITTEPRRLSPGDWLPFWEQACRADRTLPYVFVSPKLDPDTKEASLLLDPKKLHTAVGANASVFYADEAGTVDEMNYFCPREYLCYGGAVRIYYPGIRPDDPTDPPRHRYLTQAKVEEYGCDQVYVMLRRALAQDIRFNERELFLFSDCEARIRERTMRERLRALQAAHEAEQTATLDSAVNENDTLRRRAEEAEEAQLNAELLLEEQEDKYKTTINTLNAKLEARKPFVDGYSEMARSLNAIRTVHAFPDSPASVAAYYESIFGDCIAFTEQAKKSMKACVIPPETLWKVFYDLATEYRRLCIEGSGDIYRQFRESTGHDLTRGEGKQTRADKSLMRQFTDTYRGMTIDIEPHITYAGLKQSIHLGFCREENKVVIGWCGEHMPIFATQSIH